MEGGAALRRVTTPVHGACRPAEADPGNPMTGGSHSLLIADVSKHQRLRFIWPWYGLVHPICPAAFFRLFLVSEAVCEVRHSFRTHEHLPFMSRVDAHVMTKLGSPAVVATSGQDIDLYFVVRDSTQWVASTSLIILEGDASEGVLKLLLDLGYIFEVDW